MEQPSPTTSSRPTPPRARRVSSFGAFGRLRQSWLTVDKLREFGTTLALVIPLTLLIWVWAEREQNVKSEKRLFILDVRSVDPTKSMSLLRDGSQSETVSVELTGPRSGLDAVTESMRDPANSRLVIDIADPFEPSVEPYKILIGSRLNSQPLFESNGVSVIGTEPSSIQMVVDRVVTREVAVTLPPDLQSRVASAEFNPPKVRISGPERIISQLEREGKLIAELDVSNRPDLNMPKPSAKTVLSNERIKPLDVPGVKFELSQIQWAELVMSQEERGIIRSMPVYVARPAGLEDQYRITVTSATITNIEVVGPKDLIRQLVDADDNGTKHYALLTISRADQGKEGDRLPTFPTLPSAVRVEPQSVTPIHFSVTGADAANDGQLIP